jgi:hypothetical protein
VLLKEVEVAFKKATNAAILCNYQDLEGFATPFGLLKKYHALNDALNLCDVLIQSAYGLNPIELLETLKVFINTTQSLSHTLEAQEIAVLKQPQDPHTSPINLFQDSSDRQVSLQAAIEASQNLRKQFGYLLSALLTAAKHLALNRRNLTEISNFENLIREAYVVLVKMGFQRSAFHQKFVTIVGQAGVQLLQPSQTGSSFTKRVSARCLFDSRCSY